MKQVDAGLYKVADATTQKDRITGQRALSLRNRSQQIAAANQNTKNLIQQLQQAQSPVNRDVSPDAYDRAVMVFQKVHSVSHLRNEEWTVVLTNDPSFNAFVTGGTYVFIHKGLMDSVQSDDELAAVLGHEIGHVVANHIFEWEGQRLATLLTKSQSVKRESFGAAFSHENEVEADRIGILYCALAGYDPHAAARIWQRMAATVGDLQKVDLYHDHPVNSERAANCKAIADAVVQYRTPNQANPQFETLLANNVLWRTQTQELAPGKGGGLLALLETAGNAAVAHQLAKTEEARQARVSQRVDIIRKQTVIEKVELINPSTLRVQFRYNGFFSIKDIQLAAFFQGQGQEGTQVLANTGPIKPFTSYTQDFVHPQIAQMYPSYQVVQLMTAEVY